MVYGQVYHYILWFELVAFEAPQVADTGNIKKIMFNTKKTLHSVIRLCINSGVRRLSVTIKGTNKHGNKNTKHRNQ